MTATGSYAIVAKPGRARRRTIWRGLSDLEEDALRLASKAGARAADLATRFDAPIAQVLSLTRAPDTRTVIFEAKLAARLAARASRRGMRTHDFAHALIEGALRLNLVDAILGPNLKGREAAE